MQSVGVKARAEAAVGGWTRWGMDEEGEGGRKGGRLQTRPSSVLVRCCQVKPMTCGGGTSEHAQSDAVRYVDRP